VRRRDGSACFRQCTPSSHRGNSSILEDSKRGVQRRSKEGEVERSQDRVGRVRLNAGDRKSDQVLDPDREDRRPSASSIMGPIPMTSGASVPDRIRNSRFFGQTLPERQDPVEGHPVTFGGGS